LFHKRNPQFIVSKFEKDIKNGTSRNGNTNPDSLGCGLSEILLAAHARQRK
jgi:hypothetical protein